jgi:hypothetical protein
VLAAAFGGGLTETALKSVREMAKDRDALMRLIAEAMTAVKQRSPLPHCPEGQQSGGCSHRLLERISRATMAADIQPAACDRGARTGHTRPAD